ncbi:chaperonin 10-like protein [Russula earlei]|uniref:Chaperonin 10-like protein n=1 Tax=Russula earlei TaxID=71964 RepID=A0ACC0UP01_9AGAM|nr:chaperonin 10-like protein [Russula earlei]
MVCSLSILCEFSLTITAAQAAQATFKSIRSLVPLLDRVLVQRFKPDTKTATGIFLPTSATSNPLPEATVIAVGPGAPDKEGRVVPTAVKAGDRVLLPGWGGNSIKVGEEEYFLFKDSEILAKIEE